MCLLAGGVGFASLTGAATGAAGIVENPNPVPLMVCVAVRALSYWASWAANMVLDRSVEAAE